MIKKLMLLSAMLVVASVAPAAAGGMAVSTLDDPPTELVAGQDQAIGFYVRQHGVTPVTPEAGQIGIRLSNPATGETVVFPGVPQGAPGHYVSTVKVPATGTWSWEVLQGWFEPQPLGSIPVVATATGATAAAGGSTAGGSSGGVEAWRVAAIVLAALFLLGFAVDLLLGWRQSRKRRDDGRSVAVAEA